MKHLFYYLMMAVAVMTVAACGDDEGQSEPVTDKTNTNANSTATSRYASRLEFPRLKGGSSIVLTYTTGDSYGVNYSVEWDTSKKSQRWSCYQMYKGYTGSAGYYGNFEEDPDLLSAYRFSDTSSYYRGSGYTRGHICPSADRQYSKAANRQTFYYTNMQPQYYHFNSGNSVNNKSDYTGIWVQMESKVRSWASSLGSDTLYVCKGGTIDNEDQIIERVKGELIVPKYFYMALLWKHNGSYKALAFWAEHVDAAAPGARLSDYVVSIDELERKTGIDFFCNLPDNIENQVESKSAATIIKEWKVQ